MILQSILIALFTALCMEGVAWFTHKYVMHGLLWIFHRDHHHRDNEGFFEKNDFFFLIFAVPGILLMYLGSQEGWADPKLWIGAGITLYGFAYFFVHDIFIHQRFKIFRRTEHPYFKAIRRAHKMHHKHLGKEDGECFGMLWVPWKYFREAAKN
ncbi:MAG: sterol desaturase family protein [Saprospiraceae bacterium]|nr:sterol desaturase family protein [Saprospiraceae bacterium]MCF8251128.1 sterol desaturase family protein [Saprospiraceae bacterium]MCF8282960.1 sterol desaturase family protein [Bacteroidales bacterium]MCF8312914.1 sterol desaturase family protein [Saprospiraceae bacterium]MCF8441387.1 sterol desaturase family protein [Saprospiraceae bacterium]